jgi:hypothetical protein
MISVIKILNQGAPVKTGSIMMGPANTTLKVPSTIGILEGHTVTAGLD